MMNRGKGHGASGKRKGKVFLHLPLAPWPLPLTYFATSSARVSRMTVTLISPG
jgi:hypothetical protein